MLAIVRLCDAFLEIPTLLLEETVPMAESFERWPTEILADALFPVLQ